MEYLTMREIQDLFQVTRQTIYIYMHQKGLPYRRVSPRKVLFPRAEVNQWIEERHAVNERGGINGK